MISKPFINSLRFFMLCDYPEIEKNLKLYWLPLYRRRYLSDDRKVEYWGYTDIRFNPIGKYVMNLLVMGGLSDGGYSFLVKCIYRVKYSCFPLDSGGVFIDYKIKYFNSRYGRTTFFKYKNELIELGLLISFGKNYYVFNPKYLNTIRNKKKQVR